MTVDKSFFTVCCPLFQDVAEALLWAAEVHPGGCGSLQCPDKPHPRSTEAEPELHGSEHEHRPCVPTQGLWTPGSVPEGLEPAQARQVGNVSAGGLLTTGADLRNIYFICKETCIFLGFNFLI